MTVAQTVGLIRRLTGTVGDTGAYSDADILVDLNAEQERLGGVILIETAGGKWKWGDIAYTALPTYTLNLTAGTSFYQIDSLTGPLMILGVEVADQDGTYHKLDPITLESIHDQGIAQSRYYSTAGLPLEYEKREHGVFLYPRSSRGERYTDKRTADILFTRYECDYQRIRN